MFSFLLAPLTFNHVRNEDPPPLPVTVVKKKIAKAPKSLPAPFPPECATSINLRLCTCDPSADTELGRQCTGCELVKSLTFL